MSMQDKCPHSPPYKLQYSYMACERIEKAWPKLACQAEDIQNEAAKDNQNCFSPQETGGNFPARNLIE
jgi:hypothetical protein